MPWGLINPRAQSPNSNANSAMDTTMRMVNACSVRLDCPLSLIRKKSAEPILAMIPRKITMMSIFESMTAPGVARPTSILQAVLR
jgi:hypothetical protein